MIIVKTPTRIDIAGGTLDIWPLSTLFAPAVCVNIAIDLYASVNAKRIKGSNVTIVNALRTKTPFRADTKLPEGKKTLFHRVFEHIPVKGWEFTVDTRSPTGAGLGGSSSLVVALIKAACRINGEKMKDGDVITLAKNIEARHLGIPTGIQDYVAALQGGASLIRLGEGGMSPERLGADISGFAEKLLLFYSGASRISGMANWRMVKRAMDRDKVTVKVFRDIAGNSLDMADALAGGRWDKAGTLMEKENLLRSKLGSSVITPLLKKMFKEASRFGGKSKVCGAGGGGCFAVYCGGRKKEIREALARMGAIPLDFRIGKPSVRTVSL